MRKSPLTPPPRNIGQQKESTTSSLGVTAPLWPGGTEQSGQSYSRANGLLCSPKCSRAHRTPRSHPHLPPHSVTRYPCVSGGQRQKTNATTKSHL